MVWALPKTCSPGLRLVERLRLGEHHSGFNVYCGPAIWPHDEDALENLAHYIIRAAFSQERMTTITEQQSSDGTPKVIYQSKNGKTSKTFDALDWSRQRRD